MNAEAEFLKFIIHRSEFLLSFFCRLTFLGFFRLVFLPRAMERLAARPLIAAQRVRIRERRAARLQLFQLDGGVLRLRKGRRFGLRVAQVAAATNVFDGSASIFEKWPTLGADHFARTALALQFAVRAELTGDAFRQLGGQS